MTNDNQNLLRRIADYERLSGILWIILGVLQVLSIVCALAGIWNIIAGASRFKLVPRIRAADPGIPEEYQGVAQLVVLGVVNLLFGGVIGVLCVAFDFYVRDKVLSNAALFTGTPPVEPEPRPVPAHARAAITTEEQLRTLYRLHADGLVTEEEFARKKQELLGL